MLDDRHYMRSDYQPPRSPLKFRMTATNALLVSLVVAFFIQYFRTETFRGINLDYFALSPAALAKGYVWTLLTFQFLHASLSHLVMNGFVLWMFGRFVEQRLGKSRFLTLYFLSGVAGGLLQGMLGWLLPRAFGG